MQTRDLDEARALYAALMEIFVANPGGASDPRILMLVEKLCDGAAQSVDDLECRVAMRGLQSYAKLLFSDDGHLGLEAGSLRGADVLRFQIFNALSAFRGRLNVLERQPPRQPEEAPALGAKKRMRILIVEDNRDSAESLRKLLQLCGYEVTVAYTGEEGLAEAKRVRPQVVLCDIGLPGTDGYQLALALRRNPETAKARLIAVTGYGKEQDRERSREAGFQLHLVKPVDPQFLLRQLEEGAPPAPRQ